MWADEVTLVSGSGTSGYTIPDGWTSSGTVEGGAYLKLDGGTITSPEFVPHTGLSFTYSVATFGSGTDHPLTIRILNASTNDVIVEKVTSTPSSSSYITTGSPLSLGDVDVAFKIQLSAPTGKGIRLRNYSVTGTPAGGGSSLSDSDLALTSAPVALNFDLYDNSSAQTVSFTTSSTGAVTVSGGEDYVTTSISGNTITVTPVAVTPSAQTITVNQAADDTYAAGSATFTVTITDSTPIPTHTATFSVNGTTTSNEFEEGAAITFPANPADIEGKSFVGWTETAISGTTDEKPTFVTSATMGEADVTYYAVFAEIEGEPGWTETALSDIEDTDIFVFSNGSYAMSNDNGASAAPAAVAITVKDGKITSVVADNLKWNVSGNATGGYTFYPNGSTTTWMYCNTTASSSSNNNIRVGDGTRKSWIFDDNNYLVTNDSYTDRYLSIYGNSDFRGYLNTSNGAFVPKFYKYSEGSYSGYCTTVAADTREEAGLSFAESTKTVEWYDAAQYVGQALTNPNSVSPITWTSSNEEVATVEDGTVTIKALGETTIKASFDGDNNYKKGEASYVLTVQDSRTALELSFDPESVEVNVNATVAIPTLNGNQGNGTVTYASDDETIATVTEDANTSLVVTGLAEGTTTITATVAATNEYKEGTATFTVTVIDPNKKGSVNNPYTVDEARAAIDAGTGVTEVYATGIVSEIVTAFNSQYGNITYNISADGLTTSDQLQAYRGKGIGGANFTSEDDIKVGDVVVIYGDLKKHNNSIYEFDSGNQLVSLKLVAPTFYPEAGGVASGTEITISDLHTTATIYYTTNGDTPTTSSTEYNSENKPVITAATTIKAIAVKEGYTPSDVVTASYTILSPAATPTFSPEGGIYTSAQNVTISSDTENTTIYYTLDGSDPTTSSIEYTGAIVVDETVTIKAIAVKEGMANSAVASATYTMNIPSIVFDGDQNPYDVPCTAGNTNIHYVASNITGTVSLVICDANGGETTYDWFSAELYGDSYVKVQWQANPDAENSRTAYFKLTDGTTTSEIFALTQAKYVPDYAELPFAFNGGRADIEGTKGLTQEGLGSDYNTSPKLKFDGDDDCLILKINEVPGTLTFGIKGNSFSGGTFKVQTSADGVTYTDLQTYTDLTTTTQSEEFDIAANVRYIKWIYTKKVSGNVALGNITLGNTSMAVTIAAACTDGKGKYYGTFSSSSAFVVPENLTVSEIGIDDEGKMNVQNYESGAVVPANTGVMVSATSYGNFKLDKSSEAGTPIPDFTNALRPTGDNGLTATEMNSAEPETCKFYRLTMHNDTKLGFWWGADGGQSFDIVAANKAYLAVPASVAGARNGFVFGDDATGISNVNVNLNDNENCFDLQGRKVSTPGKGLYIVNGKKVVIK